MPGEELTFNYYGSGTSYTFPDGCLCGSKRCRKPNGRSIAIGGGIPNPRKVTCYFAAALQLLVQGLCEEVDSLFNQPNGQHTDLIPDAKLIGPRLEKSMKEMVQSLRHGTTLKSADVDRVLPLLLPGTLCESDPLSNNPPWFQFQDCAVPLLRLVELFWPTLWFKTIQTYSVAHNAANVRVYLDPKEMVDTVLEVKQGKVEGKLPMTMQEGIEEVFKTETAPHTFNAIKDFKKPPKQSLSFLCPKYFIARLSRNALTNTDAHRLDDVVQETFAVLLKEATMGAGPQYARLIGFILHTGSSQSGHYVTYCRRPNSMAWILYNDADVIPNVREAAILCGSAQFFLYQKCSRSVYLQARQEESSALTEVYDRISKLELQKFDVSNLTEADRTILYNTLSASFITCGGGEQHLMHQDDVVNSIGESLLDNLVQRIRIRAIKDVAHGTRRYDLRNREELQLQRENTKIELNDKLGFQLNRSKPKASNYMFFNSRDKLQRRFDESKDDMYDDFQFQRSLSELMYVSPSTLSTNKANKAEYNISKGKPHWRGKTDDDEVEKVVDRDFFRDLENPELFKTVQESCKKTPNRWHAISDVAKETLKQRAKEYDESQIVELKFMGRTKKQRLNKGHEVIPSIEEAWIGKTAKGSEEKLTDRWVDFNFGSERDFLSKCEKRRKKFIKVPVGAARDIKGDATASTTCTVSTGIMIAVQQQGEPTCVFSSLVSALTACGSHHGRAIFHVKKNVQKSLQELHRLVFANEIMRHVNYEVVKWTPNDVFNDPFTRSSVYFVLCQLEDSTGAVNHAITIHNGLIFDGNETEALPFNRENLNRCCGSMDDNNVFWKSMYAGYRYRNKNEV